MTKVFERNKLHDLIVELFKSDVELYQNVKFSMENNSFPIEKNGHSMPLHNGSFEQPNEAELLQRLEVIIDEDFNEYANVFKALA